MNPLYLLLLIPFFILPAYGYNIGFTPVYQPPGQSGGSPPTELYCVFGDFLNSYNSTTNSFTCGTAPAGSGGENNTASNVGVGEDIFKQKTGVDLEFKGIAVSGDLTIGSNTTDITISYTDPAGGSGNATVLNDLGDAIITSPPYLSTLFYNGAAWTDKIFTINTQSASNDVFITGINNQTGAITTNTFSVNTKTCSGTDKVSAINNSTGEVTCSTDQTGGGTARETLVAHFEMDRTWANIGTTMVDTYTTAEGVRIDTTGMSTVTLQIQWTKVGAGTQKCQIVDVTTPTNILIMHTNLVSGLNTNATVAIPAGLANTINTYEPQCRSSTSTDDPVWLSASVLLK